MTPNFYYFPQEGHISVPCPDESDAGDKNCLPWKQPPFRLSEDERFLLRQTLPSKSLTRIGKVFMIPRRKVINVLDACYDRHIMRHLLLEAEYQLIKQPLIVFQLRDKLLRKDNQFTNPRRHIEDNVQSGFNYAFSNMYYHKKRKKEIEATLTSGPLPGEEEKYLRHEVRLIDRTITHLMEFVQKIFD